MFVDLFERRCPNLFYSGCVIVEIRDYRQSFPVSPTTFDKSHVLLRPTNQTLLADVNSITSDGGEWTHEEKMALESQLIFAAAEPLCLDPDPAIGIRSINRQFQRKMFNSPAIRRQAKKFSQVAINRKRKTDQFTHHFGLELHDFVTKYRQKPRMSGTNSSSSSNSIKSPVTSQPNPALIRLNSTTPPKRDSILPIKAPSLEFPSTLTAPSEVHVEKLARAYDKPRETKDCMPQLIEEYVLETDRGNGRLYHIKLSIFQRPANSEYLGELYVDRDYKEGERNGEACQFSLGSRAHANRYIQQFTEIFTEEGRKKVKITHLIPGQQPRVTCTAGMWEHQQLQAQQQQQQQTINQQQTTPQTPPSLPSQSNQPNISKPFPIINAIGSSTSNIVSNNSGKVLTTAVSKPSSAGMILSSPTTPSSTNSSLMASPPNMLSSTTTTGPQIKLPNLGQNQIIGFTTTTTLTNAQGMIPTTLDQSQTQQQQQPIQYAATIMNCDNNLLKTAITSPQLGIRNGSLVLLQPNNQHQVKAMVGQNQQQLQGLVMSPQSTNSNRPMGQGNNSGCVSVLVS